MKTSQAGRAFIKSKESCSLVAYPDPGTGGDPWTCGFGQTGKGIKRGTRITQATADEWFDEEIVTIEKGILSLLKVAVSQGEFDALVSFVFNCGIGNFRTSTLLRKLNASDRIGAAAEFPRWNKAAGKVLRGLTTRRNEEMLMFLKGLRKA